MTTSILQRIASGDAAAVQDCIDRYGGLVWSIARRLAPTLQDAEDGVQEIFLDLWRTAGRFNPEIGSEATFIATVARRRLLDQRRRAIRRPDAEPLQSADVLPEPTREPTAEVDDEAARVLKVLGTLEDVRRTVLELSMRDGFSHESISKSMGIPLGTVKSHARRGLAQLRELLIRPDSATAGGGQR